MIASSLLPSRFRGEQPASKAEPPSWLNTRISPFLQVVSRLAASHPIHTVVLVALMVSSSYLGLLEESLFDTTTTVRKADWTTFAEGSRSLRAGPDSAFKWQTWDSDAQVATDADHLALLTFVFPESVSNDAPHSAPPLQTIPMPQNLSVTPLPSTSNSLTAYSQEISMALAVPFSQAPEFLSAAQEIPSETLEQETRDTGNGKETKMWIMKAARVHPSSSIVRWASNAWLDFIDLLKNAEAMDIIIMVLGYISMHLTFVSLFLSMRRLGSNFWLAASTLLSSAFAFMFSLIVTTKLGVPVSMVLLSEGLPFLVVTIGFEKNITLTRAVLTHSIEHKALQDKQGKNSSTSASNVIQSAIQVAIREKGFEIVKDYVIEIVVLILGAASGVQGGLQHFCFLAAWILFFDCILLFTFYTAILCIKLEINRIKRHVEMRRALEDDGVSRRVAENVAQNNDWPRADGKGQPGTSLFGKQIKSTSVPKFKVFMVGGFVLINAINLCTIPFRGTDSSGASSWTGGFGGLVASPPVDPFKVASNGLDSILAQAAASDREVVVTILTPIKYELEFPSVHYGKVAPETPVKDEDVSYVMGGRMVGGVLKSLEDPVLSKWIIAALALSVAFNGYLFNAARWGIKDPNLPDRPIDARELARAQKFNDADATPTSAVFERGRGAASESMPPTPAPTDDEADAVTIQRKASSLSIVQDGPKRPYAELERMLQEKRITEMTDEEIIGLALKGKVPGHSLERALKDTTRAVKIRRAIIARTKATTDITNSLERSKLPYEHYNWDLVLGACCENVIGYMPLPVGVAGPLVIDGKSFFIPMATTEGVLVASASRGCKAINAGGGAVTVLTGDGMTRGPCVTFETLERTGAAKLWLDSEAGQTAMKDAFNSTSRFARLQSMTSTIAGTNLYIRFKSQTGDAMGMNMISKGVEHALSVMANDHGFDDMQIVSLSGNYCIDKKPAAINWIEGRGKSVVAEAIIPGDVVKSVLKTDVDSLVDLNINKNLIGSAMAASVGGFNAHAANLVAAIFIATGQDPAQVVESANCITIMKK